ncbi:hypothetical protein VNI00_016902 [Paramarasmius palmivorus]|uniref:Uncharacterized protein n=1 Tax=Paramarasmius palmivorus TaxID=297713 RepID=A0AAW0BC70_9AGAR
MSDVEDPTPQALSISMYDGKESPSTSEDSREVSSLPTTEQEKTLISADLHLRPPSTPRSHSVIHASDSLPPLSLSRRRSPRSHIAVTPKSWRKFKSNLSPSSRRFYWRNLTGASRNSILVRRVT